MALNPSVVLGILTQGLGIHSAMSRPTAIMPSASTLRTSTDMGTVDNIGYFLYRGPVSFPPADAFPGVPVQGVGGDAGGYAQFTQPSRISTIVGGVRKECHDVLCP